MKRKFLASVVAAVMIAASSAGFAAAAGTDVGPAGSFTPGTFTGTSTGYGGAFEVEVTFSETNMLDIEVTVTNETPMWFRAATGAMIPAMLATQSPHVDLVAGATMSSFALFAAVVDAIGQAGGNPMTMQPLAELPVQPLPDNTQADVIIVGSGYGGLAAAVSAAQNGASVILIEWKGKIGGTTATALGNTTAAGSSVQIEAGNYEYSKEYLVNYWMTQQGNSHRMDGWIPARSLTVAMNSAERIEWLRDLGMEFQPATWRMHIPVLPPGETPGGAVLVEFLADRATELGVEIHINTRGMELVKTDGRVSGVIAQAPAGEILFEANNAVILATGGWAHNRDIIAEVAPVYLPWMHFTDATVGHMGDGIFMAQAIGAAIDEYFWFIGAGLRSLQTGMPNSASLPIGHTFVTPEGRRFTNEAHMASINFTDMLFNTPEGSFMIFDSSFENLANLAEAFGADNELVFRADTVAELAALLNAPYLEATVDHIADVAAGRVRDEMGRPAAHAVALTQGPFYAVFYHPFNNGTIGGVVTDQQKRVLDTEGEPIPGLFAVGETANRAYWAQVYIGGTSFQTTLTGGIIAGELAATE